MQLNRAIVDMIDGGKQILIISPQPWEGFRVSKHHYAIELAERGNRVFFVDPPLLDGNLRPGGIKLAGTRVAGIQSIKYRPRFPYTLKFHCRWLFDRLMRQQAKRIRAACGDRLDVVWDFDNTYNFANLEEFGTSLKIFHPVDQIVTHCSSTKQADIVFAIAQSILDRISLGETPAHRIGHGLSRLHVDFARRRIAEDASPTCTQLRIGYVGNLLHPAVDRECISAVVVANPDVRFDFFGPYCDPDGDPPLHRWIESLVGRANCHFYGLCDQALILSHAENIQGWLVCYDSSKDMNNGADSHKILEYLATGAPVTSSRIDAYADNDLLYMPKMKSNDRVLSCFSEMKHDLLLGKDDRRRERLEFALQRSYGDRLNEICKMVSMSNALTSTDLKCIGRSTGSATSSPLAK